MRYKNDLPLSAVVDEPKFVMHTSLHECDRAT